MEITEGGSFPENIGDEYFASFRYGAVSQVPEPPTWALMLAGLAAAAFVQRRRTRTAFA